MLNKLSDLTSLNPLGLPTGRQLLRVPSGPYAGRLVAIFLATPSELRLTFADPPFTSWSSPEVVVDDCTDAPFDCCIGPDNVIHIAYLAADISTLKTRKLSYAGGAWTPSSSVTAYNVDPTANPSIVIDTASTLWLSFNRYSAGSWYVQIKSSTDSGTTWGTGPTDPGETVSTGANQITSKSIAAPESLHLFLAYGSTKLVARARPLPSGNWSDEFMVATALTGFNDQFDAALGPDGRVAIVYNDSQFRVREFDGLSWSAATTLATELQDSPQIIYIDNYPAVLWLQSFSGDQKRLMFSSRRTGTFSEPAPLDPRADLFDSVLLFNHAAGTFEDLTSESASSASGDVVHPASNCLVKQPGDALYVGMNDRFRYLHLSLSTAGAGGDLTYSYWNGATWVNFTPASGPSNFDAATLRIHLWTDYRAIPLDWQQCAIGGLQRFWVKCEVLSAFATGPVGSQIAAVSEITALSARR